MGTRLSSQLRAPPTLSPDHTSHLPPADGVESGAGGVGHRPGGTEQGRAVGGKQGGHFPAGRTFAPQPKQADLARCLLLLTLEKILN